MATVSELADTERDLYEALREYLELRGVSLYTIFFIEGEITELLDDHVAVLQEET